MKSRKRKILKLGIMCLMPLLALLLTISNSYAYYLNNDGNLQSENLANLDNLYNIQAVNAYSYNVSNQVITITQNSSTSDPYIYFNDFITLNSGSYSIYYLVDIMEVQYLGLTTNNTTNIVHSIPYQNYSRITINQTTTFGFGFEGFGAINRQFNIRIMIYNDNSQLNYEPYGVWYNSDKFETTNYGPLYKVLNGTTAKLYDFNSNQLDDLLSATPIINETIVWNNNYDFNDFMIPNIRNAILNGSDALYNVERPMVLLSLKTPLLIDNLSFYRMVSNEIRYIYLYFDDGSMESVSIANASDVSTKYSIWYNESKKSLTYIAFDNEVNFDMISSITQPGYSMVYSDAYNNGSIDGYKEGYSYGIKQSNPISYREGYNAGYNVGIQEDIESSGFRTLITTILSYPVNMVRESLNFEFMGVHVASIVLFIVSLGIVAFVIKRFKD